MSEQCKLLGSPMQSLNCHGCATKECEFTTDVRGAARNDSITVKTLSSPSQDSCVPFGLSPSPS